MLTSHMQISAETEIAPAQRTVSVPGRRAPDERVFNFTEDTIRKARPQGERCWYWDKKVPELGLEVRASGSRCFVLRYGDKRRKLKPEHQWPHASIAAVREAARALLVEAA